MARTILRPLRGGKGGSSGFLLGSLPPVLQLVTLTGEVDGHRKMQQAVEDRRRDDRIAEKSGGLIAAMFGHCWAGSDRAFNHPGKFIH